MKERKKMLDNLSDEQKFFIYLFVALFLWFGLIINYVLGFMVDNFIIAYIIFIIIYSYFGFKYILLLGDPIENNKLFFAFVIWEFVHDLFMFPYLVTKAGVMEMPIESLFSSDVFLYRLLPVMPEIMKYFSVYVVIPTILLILARTIAGKKVFWKALRGRD